MKVLVSVRNAEEACACLDAGVAIVDVKNPEEGSLGASFPWVIRQVREALGSGRPLSATLGDVPNKPGTISLAAAGCAFAGADYVKVGLFGVATVREAVQLMAAVKRATSMVRDGITVVGCAYADFDRVGAIAPLDAVAAMADAGCDGVMIDTAVKEGRGLLSCLDGGYLSRFVQAARQRRLLTALAGSVQRTDIPALAEIGPDIIGIRGAVCDGGDRLAGTLRRDKVIAFIADVDGCAGVG